MQILTDACLAFLASIGLWTLGQMILSRFLAGLDKPEWMTVIRVWGDCNNLEHSLEKLLCKPYGSDVLLLDCGLTKDGIDKVDSLLERYANVRLCSCDGWSFK